MSRDQRTPKGEPISTGTLVARILLAGFVLAALGVAIWFVVR
jgi:hypothetical protein